MSHDLESASQPAKKIPENHPDSTPKVAEFELPNNHTSTSETRQNFSYFSQAFLVRDLFSHINGEPPEELRYLDEELGLENMFFKAYARNNKIMKNSGTYKSPKVYVLLHGWTGNHKIWSEVKNQNGLSIVEEILTRDPEAIVITPDGNGFGQTTFKKDLSLQKLKDKCTAEAYAKQMDFLVSKVLGINQIEAQSRVHFLGHSMGGAACYELAKLGYKNLTAVAPAALAKVSEVNRVAVREVVPGFTGQTELLDFQKSARVIYLGLQSAIRAGQLTSPLGQPITELVFNYILAETLMGKNTTGDLDPHLVEQIINSLKTIHKEELSKEKLLTAATTIGQLSLHRTDFSDWNLDEMANLAHVQVFMGGSDVLVKPSDISDYLRAAVARAQAIKVEAEKSAGDIDPAQQIELSLRRKFDIFEQGNRINFAGHYSVLYSQKVLEALLRT